jgi:3-hydroxyacyl-CoA dehydrogenase
VLLPALQEAAALVREGMSLARVDGALRRFGFTYGPLEYLDLLGLDVAAEVAQDLTLDNGFTRMLDAGCLGVKAGTGFYQYRVGRRRPNADAQRLLRADATSSLPPLSLADQGRLARERVTGLLLLHAARALEEGIVPDATILDFALCQTIWPPHRGGPIAYARALPAGALAKQLDRLAHDFGPRFETSATALALLAG